MMQMFVCIFVYILVVIVAVAVAAIGVLVAEDALVKAYLFDAFVCFSCKNLFVNLCMATKILTQSSDKAQTAR